MYPYLVIHTCGACGLLTLSLVVERRNNLGRVSHKSISFQVSYSKVFENFGIKALSSSNGTLESLKLFLNPHQAVAKLFPITKGLCGAQGRNKDGLPMPCMLLSQKLVLAKIVMPLIPIKVEWKVVEDKYGLCMRLLIVVDPLFATLRHLRTWSYLYFFLLFFFFFFFFFFLFLFFLFLFFLRELHVSFCKGF